MHTLKTAGWTLLISLLCATGAPRAFADTAPRPDRMAVVGSTVQLGDGVDPVPGQGYQWTQTAGPSVPIQGGSTLQASFPMGPCSRYAFRLASTGPAGSFAWDVAVRPYLSGGMRLETDVGSGICKYWAPGDFPIHYRINLAGLANSPTAAQMIASIQAGLQIWEDLPDSYVRFIYDGTSTALPGNTDGINLVYADVNRTYVQGGAVTGVRSDADGRIRGGNIMFYAGPYSSYVGSPDDMKAMILHESAHLLGFDHSVSGPDSAVYDSSLQRIPAPHDKAMVSALYPDAGFFAATGSVSGKVLLPSGAPAAVAVVLVDPSRAQPRVYGGHSDPGDGSFVVNGIQPGQYLVVLEKEKRGGSQDFLSAAALSGAPVSVSAGADSAVGMVTLQGTPYPRIPIQPTGEQIAYAGTCPLPGGGVTFVHTQRYLHFYRGDTDTSGWSIPDSGNADFISPYLRGSDYSPPTKRLYVVDHRQKCLFAFDADPQSPSFGKVAATIRRLPGQPIEAVYDEAHRKVLVACFGDRRGAVVDELLGKGKKKIKVKGYTQDIALSPDRRFAYAGTYGEVGLLDGITSHIAEIGMDPLNRKTYMKVIRFLPVGNNGAYYQASDGRRVFSASKTTLDAVDLATGAVSVLDTTDTSAELAISPDARFLYYMAYDDPSLRNSQLRVYDLAAGTVVQRITLSSERHESLQLSSDGSRLSTASVGGAWLTFSVHPADGTLAWIPVPNQPPRVFAGININLPANGTHLHGAVVDDGRPGPLSISWSKVSGPGEVGFSNPADPQTPVSFSVPGSYRLRLTASDGERTGSSEVWITAN